jgi:trimeric autotransporter adhesin
LSSGTVVELVDDKIKVCEDANNAIGVISATPTVVGNCEDGTSDEWVGKYEKDIWGKTIYEDYTYEIPISIDENGETIYKTKTSQQPKIHPNYNPDIIYIPRSKRPEWNIVGLMGQIKVLKNQQIPTRWIKMKDINDEIALYLVK